MQKNIFIEQKKSYFLLSGKGDGVVEPCLNIKLILFHHFVLTASPGSINFSYLFGSHQQTKVSQNGSAGAQRPAAPHHSTHSFPPGSRLHFLQLHPAPAKPVPPAARSESAAAAS